MKHQFLTNSLQLVTHKQKQCYQSALTGLKCETRQMQHRSYFCVRYGTSCAESLSLKDTDEASDYQEWKCTSVMEALYECCAKAGNESLVCSGIHPKKTGDGIAAGYKPQISEESSSSS